MPFILLILAAFAGHAGPNVIPLESGSLKDERFVEGAACGDLDQAPEAAAFCDVVAVGNDFAWPCSGIQLSEHWILSARHCLPATRVAWGVDVARPTRTARIVQVEVPDVPGIDAVLLRVDQPVPWAHRAVRKPGDTEPPSRTLRAIGFGAASHHLGGTGTKRGVYIRPPGDWGCDPLLSAATGCHARTEMVIADHSGKDTCNGDSGGPVFEPTEDGWQLLGIVSRPIRNGLVLCGDGGIYTRIDALGDWMRPILDSGGSR